MARTADPRRRREVIDAAIDALAEIGVASMSLRSLAQAMGSTTRVLTHHFADKNALLTAVLERLDQVQHDALRATEGWDDTARGIGDIVRDSWHRHLRPENLAQTRLVHEVEGLAAAGRLRGHVPAFLAGRVELVAEALVSRGLDPARARASATLLNNAYSGLQTDRLVSGDTARISAALDTLCALADSWTSVQS